MERIPARDSEAMMAHAMKRVPCEGGVTKGGAGRLGIVEAEG